MQSKIVADVSLSEVPTLHKRPVAKPLADYTRKFKVRNEAIVVAYRSGGYTQREIAHAF
ncbi:MAG: hypothetical protein AB7F79_00250 [Steroidobacteraceae bacterium]